ncbi:MAG: hypothetical protein GKR97_19205 [Rhizobiaceae bacterium]|nr:hypothetical protein [Rhizobiaceae bacterium]
MKAVPDMMFRDGSAIGRDTSIKNSCGAVKTAFRISLLPVLMAALASCSATTTAPEPQQVAAPRPIQIDMATLPGDYGLASYQRAEDRERTLKQAKIACQNPFNVAAGSNGGVVMHAAGQAGPTEMFLKKDGQGRSFLGPRGEAGSTNDQRILSYDDGILITQPMQPRLQSVYGNIVLVPCAKG